jgi:hypothetical protein
MLGLPKPRRLDEPIAVSLEDLVPPNNFYRHLEATLDLGFVRDWTRELYADRGHPSIDLVIFFKLLSVMFFEGIRSERQLIETARLNLTRRSSETGVPHWEPLRSLPHPPAAHPLGSRMGERGGVRQRPSPRPRRVSGLRASRAGRGRPP